MRILLALLAVALLAAVGVASPASAQSLPGGSWQGSCQDGIMRGAQLSAQCKATNGRWVWSSINVNGCRAFGNSNGRLFCEHSGGTHPGGWRPGGRLPGGSWQASCQNGRLRGNVLTASCSDGRVYVTSSINVRSCPRQQFGNRNGYLFCER